MIDWFDEINADQQRDVLEGIAEADRGETVPHSEVVKLFGKWGLK
jgi:predicted transcriptional regulator